VFLLGPQPYIRYVEVLIKTYNEGDRTFYDAITVNVLIIRRLIGFGIFGELLYIAGAISISRFWKSSRVFQIGGIFIFKKDTLIRKRRMGVCTN